jgi:hypothetical protein
MTDQIDQRNFLDCDRARGAGRGRFRRLLVASIALICACPTNAARSSDEPQWCDAPNGDGGIHHSAVATRLSIAAQPPPGMGAIRIVDNQKKQNAGSENQAPPVAAPDQPAPPVACSPKELMPDARCPSGFMWQQKCGRENKDLGCAEQTSP